MHESTPDEHKDEDFGSLTEQLQREKRKVTKLWEKIVSS